MSSVFGYMVFMKSPIMSSEVTERINQGIALCRISSINQSEGHSLEAQRSNVDKKAGEMNSSIIKYWEVIRSSKAGKNISRRDLEEILRFCRQNKNIKYLFIDRVNRLMREMMYMIHYIVELEILGVKVIFCDPSQQHLNGSDQLSKLMLIIEAFKSEQENVEREQTVVSRMKARYAAGYYLSHPHPGYMKSETPGLHVPDPVRFGLLKQACRLIIYKQFSVPEAIRWLRDSGYRTLGGKVLDSNHFIRFINDRYYCGIIDINSEGWPKGINGLHERMLSVREHTALVSILKKRNPRTRQRHNPEFPMSNILRHYECKDQGKYEKFTGFKHNRGMRNGKQRPLSPIYSCRDCRKSITRDKAHAAFNKTLQNLTFLPSSDTFLASLERVWKKQLGSAQNRVNTLIANRQRLEHELMELTKTYTTENSAIMKTSIKRLIEDYEKKLQYINSRIEESKNLDLESEKFVRFSIKFVENLKEKWWNLSPETRKRGEQILFNGKIYIDNDANVHTPNLSSIYRLGTNKKALSGLDNAHLVELVGTAPTSDW